MDRFIEVLYEISYHSNKFNICLEHPKKQALLKPYIVNHWGADFGDAIYRMKDILKDQVFLDVHEGDLPVIFRKK